MQNVVSVPVLAASSLLAAQGVLILIRTASCVRRPVPLLLAGFLGAMTIGLLLPTDSAVREWALIAMIWTAGAFLIRSTNRKMFGAWSGASLALLLTLLLARSIGYQNTASFMALRSFGITVVASIPLSILFLIGRANRSIAALATFIAGALWLGSAGIGTLGGLAALESGPLAATPPLLLSMCTGWLVFQEGYPERTSWRGSLPGLAQKEGLAQSMYARLLATETALAWQERITAAGFLALGAAHEFKNTLSNVKLAALHGLSQGEPARKDDCLTLIIENTRTARDSAIELLERISLNGGDVPCSLDAARELSVPVRRAGAVLRGEGITIETDFEARVAFRARRFDVEQIILNLINNAAESYRRMPGQEVRTITIRTRADDESAIIEVRDLAGGVPEGIRCRLFNPSVSGTASSGLGLYLSRNLALANAGNLEYQPVEGGSVFRLTLPAASEADAF